MLCPGVYAFHRGMFPLQNGPVRVLNPPAGELELLLARKPGVFLFKNEAPRWGHEIQCEIVHVCVCVWTQYIQAVLSKNLENHEKLTAGGQSSCYW